MSTTTTNNNNKNKNKKKKITKDSISARSPASPTSPPIPIPIPIPGLTSLPDGVDGLTGQWQDRENVSALGALVQTNPVLRKISQAGAKAPKKLLYPTTDCDYFYDYLSHFPAGTWALPQVFCRVIRGLNSNHWLALAAARFRERRSSSGPDCSRHHRGSGGSA